MIRASMSEMEGSTYERRDGEPVDSLLNCDSFAEEEARREQVCLVLFGFILTLFDYVHARALSNQAIREIFTIPFHMDSQITITRRDLPAETYYNPDGSVNWSIEPTSEYTIEMSLPDDMVDGAVDFIEQYMIDNDMAIYADDPLTNDGIVYLVIEQEAFWHLVPVFTDAFIAFARDL